MTEQVRSVSDREEMSSDPNYSGRVYFAALCRIIFDENAPVFRELFLTTWKRYWGAEWNDDPKKHASILIFGDFDHSESRFNATLSITTDYQNLEIGGHDVFMSNEIAKKLCDDMVKAFETGCPVPDDKRYAAYSCKQQNIPNFICITHAGANEKLYVPVPSDSKYLHLKSTCRVKKTNYSFPQDFLDRSDSTDAIELYTRSTKFLVDNVKGSMLMNKEHRLVSKVLLHALNGDVNSWDTSMLKWAIKYSKHDLISQLSPFNSEFDGAMEKVTAVRNSLAHIRGAFMEKSEFEAHAKKVIDAMRIFEKILSDLKGSAVYLPCCRADYIKDLLKDVDLDPHSLGLDRYIRELASVKQELLSLQAEYGLLRAENSVLQAETSSLLAEKSSLQEEYHELKDKYTIMKDKIEQMASEVDPVSMQHRILSGFDDEFIGRKIIFSEIEKWCKEPGNDRAYVIQGTMGTGKSSLLAHFLRRPELSRGRVVAFHFCKRGFSQTLLASNFLQNIVRQLMDEPVLEEYRIKVESEGCAELLEALLNNKTAGYELSHLFNELVVKPLASCRRFNTQQTFLVLIDALDESVDAEGTSFDTSVIHFLRKNATLFQRLPKWLHILASTKPDVMIWTQERHLPITQVDITSHDKGDVDKYVKNRLKLRFDWLHGRRDVESVPHMRPEIGKIEQASSTDDIHLISSEGVVRAPKLLRTYSEFVEVCCDEVDTDDIIEIGLPKFLTATLEHIVRLLPDVEQGNSERGSRSPIWVRTVQRLRALDLGEVCDVIIAANFMWIGEIVDLGFERLAQLLNVDDTSKLLPFHDLRRLFEDHVDNHYVDDALRLAFSAERQSNDLPALGAYVEETARVVNAKTGDNFFQFAKIVCDALHDGNYSVEDLKAETFPTTLTDLYKDVLSRKFGNPASRANLCSNNTLSQKESSCTFEKFCPLLWLTAPFDSKQTNEADNVTNERRPDVTTRTSISRYNMEYYGTTFRPVFSVMLASRSPLTLASLQHAISFALRSHVYCF